MTSTIIHHTTALFLCVVSRTCFSTLSLIFPEHFMAHKDDRASNTSIPPEQTTSLKYNNTDSHSSLSSINTHLLDSSVNSLTDGRVPGTEDIVSKEPTRIQLHTQPLPHDELTTIHLPTSPAPLPRLDILPNPLASTMARDSLLAYAHSIYNQTTSPSSSTIISQRTIQMPFFLPLLLQQDLTDQPTPSTSISTPKPNSVQPQRHTLKTTLVPLLMSLLKLHPCVSNLCILQTTILFIFTPKCSSSHTTFVVMRAILSRRLQCQPQGQCTNSQA